MKIPKITYTLYPTSDIERIALIDASRQKLEASLFKYPIRESLFFCFRYRRGAAYMDIYNTEGFSRLAPNHGYQFILRVSPSEGGYTALEAIRETASEPWTPKGHPLAFHIEYGKGLIERHFDKMDEEQKNAAPRHQCPCCVMLRVDSAELAQLIRSRVKPSY